MKCKLLYVLAGAILFLIPIVTFGQAPSLGTAANFVLFTTNGAMTNSGIPHLTHLTGEVGSNLAASVTGFGNVDGQVHDFDAVTGTCTSDVLNAYSQLNLATPTAAHAVGLGSETLFAGIYHISANATLSSTLTLDAQGNPNAVFIFQIQGTLSTTTLSKVTLINGGLACNVFWKVEGVVSMASGSTMRGTIIANNAAINLTSLDTLEGRALSINGAVSVSELMAYTPIGCGSAVLTGPAAPPLVAAGTFGVFSSIGGVTGTLLTHIVGDVGSNSTTTTGFNPSFVTGMIHPNPDVATAAAASNLTTVYNDLNTLAVDIDLLDPANFGYGLVLTPHTYLLGAATTFTDNLYLNAEGDANAVFVIQVNGSFTTSTLSEVILTNGAQAKNVYWLINGAVHIYDNSVFNGTIVAAGAITLNTGDTLNGRALTINGAIAINGNYVTNNPAPSCVAAPISGTNNICTGSTTTLSDSDAGGTWSSNNSAVAAIGSSSGIVTAGIIPGTVIITYTSLLACVNTMSLTVNAGASPITGPGNVCVGSSINLSDITPGGSWSSSNTLFATVGTASGMVTGVTSGVPTITYTTSSGCIATKSVTVGSASGAGTITGPSGVCVGSSITLSDGIAGGTWSSSNTTATISGGMVTGASPGTDTIRYRVTSTCGADTATKTITINASSNAGAITGPSGVCTGSSITLSDNVAGGTWSSSNTTATVSGGMVMGNLPGIDTISYSVNNGCGLAATTKTVTINASPNAGVITGPSVVCVGSFITLSDNIPGGIWSSSNTTATVIAGMVTGGAGGIDTIRYSVTNVSCTSTATKNITINSSSNAGAITGPSSVCIGSTILLSDNVPGGTWSSSNTNATVLGGLVTGAAAGTDIISYLVTNACGSATATTTITITNSPGAGTITGPSSVCIGLSIILSDNVAGGVWSRSNAAATVVSGVVTGIAGGMDTIMYTVTGLGCTATATKIVAVNTFQTAGTITGTSSVCVGSFITLTDSTPGGIWSSSNTTAIVAGGLVTGAAGGTDTVSYSVTNACSTATTTKTVTINASPGAGAITGPSSVCLGSSITLSDNLAGGTWSGSNTTAAVSGGIVTGTTAGTDIISYSANNGCGLAATTKTVTINALPNAGTITGPSNVCVGLSVTLLDGVAGGLWSSSNTLAIVSGGVVTAVTGGVDTIMYTVTASGCMATSIKTVTVNIFGNAGSITGAAIICEGSITTLSDSVAGGIWSSSNAVATVGGGVVLGLTPGADTISYTVTNVCNTAITAQIITVNPLPVAGSISGAVSVCIGSPVILSDWIGGGVWSSNDLAVATISGAGVVTGIVPGTVLITYAVINSCGTATATDMITVVSLADCTTGVKVPAGATIEFSVYPNPNNGSFFVLLKSANDEPVTIVVTNIVGEKLKVITTATNMETELKLNAPSGVYFLSASTTHSSYTGKVVIGE